MHNSSEVIIGAGPAGLAAAFELGRRGRRPLIVEQADKVGGIARTESYKGYRFDIGGHRFYTKVPEVQQLWQEMLGDDFIKVGRLSRIFYRGRFFNYPLSAVNVLRNLGPVECVAILASYLQARIRPSREEETFEQWVVNRFGKRLYRTFFKTYTEKVWGIPCSEIRADWAAQRIKGMSLVTAMLNALFRVKTAKSLIEEFDYPRLGPGQMWERFHERIEQQGGNLLLDTPVVTINRDGWRIKSVTVRSVKPKASVKDATDKKDRRHAKDAFSEGDARHVELKANQFISSMPVTKLILQMNPPAPAAVREAARALKYRDFLIVALIVNQPELFPDNWIYVHTPDARVGRIQNFKNWSHEMVPDPGKTCLGMEYFCSLGDDLWERSDEELIDLARREIEQLGLAKAVDVEDGCVLRQPKAYPVYDADYRRHLEVIRGFLNRFENLQTIGRNGMHRYNNQDHSMLCGLYAARNVLGADHDLWDVNTERSYYEEQQVDRGGKREAEQEEPRILPGPRPRMFPLRDVRRPQSAGRRAA